MSIIFESSPSYSMLIVVRGSWEDAYNDWTEAHCDQGFSWRDGCVSFDVISSDACRVEVLTESENSSFEGEPLRKIIVPFTADGSPIKIGDLFLPKVMPLAEGTYQLSCELFSGVGEDSDGTPFDYLVRFRFVPDSMPRFAVLKQDESMNFNGTIVTHAEPAR